MAEVHVDDDGFVRAPRGLAYRVLTDLGQWPTFWPGCRVAARGDAFEVLLRPDRWSRPLPLVLRPHAWRHDEGFAVDVDGALRGRGEFWLEAGWGGTVVHHLLAAEVVSGRPHRVLPAYRAALRRGLCGLKDSLQSDVRRLLDLTP